jgi:hypothetical protein
MHARMHIYVSREVQMLVLLPELPLLPVWLKMNFNVATGICPYTDHSLPCIRAILRLSGQ